MTWITVDVDLSDLNDSDIEEEYNSRKLGTSTDPDEQCQRAYMLHHQGRKDEAYAILWEICLDRVNKVV
jgi:bacillopeptidase F (M6 metalloprotease family)